MTWCASIRAGWCRGTYTAESREDGHNTTHRLHKQDVGEDKEGEEPSTITTPIDSSRVPDQRSGQRIRGNEKRKGRWEVEGNLLRRVEVG